MGHRSLSLALQLGSVAVFLAGWQAIVLGQPHLAFFVGSPSGVAAALTQSATLGRLPSDIGLTAFEAIIGFLIGSGAGIGVGLGLWLSRAAFDLLRPYLLFVAAVPVFALGPMFVFWFGTELPSKVALVFVATFSLAVMQAYQGAKSCDPNLVKLGVAFGATRFQLLVKLIVPSAISWVLSATRINIGMALLGAIIGEFISSNHGLGNLLLYAEGLYDVNLMIGCIMCIGVLALAFNGVVDIIEKSARRYLPNPAGPRRAWFED
jgi:NitT/TauT family transport system permease protein